MAVKITVVPAQTSFDEADIEMLTGRAEFTVILIEFEVAGLLEGQDTSDVNSHVITSLFEGT